MYKKIMVPLDGSELAECVLPHVESIVKGCKTPEIIFTRVVEPEYLPVGVLSDGSYIFTDKDAEEARKLTDKNNRADAENYLNGIAHQYRYDDATNHTVVLTGKAAETIADYATENGIDLIVIATHGRSGVSRWVFGSTADKILRSSCVPVLMIRAPGCIPSI